MIAPHCTSSRYGTFSCTIHSSSDLGQFWNGRHFERSSLRLLGYRFYASHEHTPCPSADRIQTLVVVDINGVHHVDVQFCACTESPRWVENYRQLLRLRWYPASFQKPKTAFTFDMLNDYHKYALQAKLNLYDYYSTVMQKTDNSGREKAIVSYITPHSFPITDVQYQYRYHEMSQCVRQWRSIKQIKRGGGGHNPNGLTSITEGSLAIECPACPHPGRNLPQGWDDALGDKRYVCLSHWHPALV